MLPLNPSRIPLKFTPLKWPFSAPFTKLPFDLVKLYA
jgi:hypothetical protein